MRSFEAFSLLVLALSAGCSRANNAFRTVARRASGADTHAHSLASLEALVQQQASTIQSIQSELSVTQNRLEEVETQLASRVQALESNAQGHSDQFALLKNKLATSAAFTVRFSHDPVSDVGQHAVLKFDDVQFNLGNNYQPSTGIFTAPVSGVYAFFLSLMGSWQWSELSLVKDGNVVDSVHVNDDTYDQGSLFETIHLDAGSMVWVQHSFGSTAIKGGSWTDFTGFLVKAD